MTKKRPRLALPPLAARDAEALNHALDYAFTLVEPDTPDALIVAGTRVRATTAAPADADSDFDIHVVHEEPWRQRVSRRFNGVPCEFFINPFAQMRRYFVAEAPSGRPVTAHMLATGVIAYDPLGRAAALATEAKALLAAGWHLDETEKTRRRYFAACLLEDAREAAARCPANAELLLPQAVEAMLELMFALHGQWLPRPKERMQALAHLDPAGAALVEACFAGHDLSARVRAAERLADRVIGARGFFDWMSAREPALSHGL